MAAVSSSSQNPANAWSNPSTSSSQRVEPLAAVQDDWEDDNNDSDLEESNRRIWEAANTKAPVPMPTVVLSPSSTSARSVLSPPEGAFQPAMRILKRPTNSASQSTTASLLPAASTAESLQEKEARYQAARERIFGPESNEEVSSQATKEKKDKKSSKAPHTPVRSPRGPATLDGAPQRGFERRTKPPTPPQNNPASTVHGQLDF